MLHLDHNYLRSLSRQVLVALGTPPDMADVVTESLVGANLAGHDSHGTMRLPLYAAAIRAGRMDPAVRAQVLPATAMLATLTVDGAWGWGPPAAYLAMDSAIERAGLYGISAAAVRRCHHIMRVGQYVEHAAARGMIGIVFCNSGPGVAPHGGRGRVLGTNPIAIGIPRAGGNPPLMLDGSTSVVAEGKLKVLLDKGLPTPEGWIIDMQGMPTTRTQDFYDGGAILPMGGHKGYALGVMVEMIGGVLSGMSASFLPGYSGGNGVMVMALRPDAFMPMSEFTDQVERACAVLQASPGAPEGSGRPTEVLLPGEPETRSRRDRMANGVPMAEATWADIKALAESLGISV